MKLIYYKVDVCEQQAVKHLVVEGHVDRLLYPAQTSGHGAAVEVTSNFCMYVYYEVKSIDCLSIDKFLF